MSTLSVSTKKRLLISGLAILCVVLVGIVVSIVGGNVKNDKTSITDEIGSNVDVEEIKGDDKADDKADGATGVAVPEITETPAGGKESQTAGNENLVLDISKQQDVEVPITKPQQKPAEPEKPVVKDEAALKNPDTPPVYDKKQTTVEKKSSAPKSGDKKDGKVYIPGFGWVVDEGGGSQGEVIGSNGDINKQVGIMD